MKSSHLPDLKASKIIVDCAPGDARAPRTFPPRLPPSQFFFSQKLLVRRSLHVLRAGWEQLRQVSGGPWSPSSTESWPGPASCSACTLLRHCLQQQLLRKVAAAGSSLLPLHSYPRHNVHNLSSCLTWGLLPPGLGAHTHHTRAHNHTYS